MLGLGRASQYAGWWSGGAINISIPVATTVSQAAYQTPVFSWKTGSGFSPQTTGGWNQPGEVGSAVDVSGYDSLTGFNNLRCTFAITFQLPWSSGLADGFYGQAIITLGVPSSSSYQFAIQGRLNNSGKLSFPAGSTNGSGGPGQNGSDLPGVYTDYTNTWLTVIYCQAETSAAYTNWSGTGSGDVFCRTAVYNTETGALIKKTDEQQSSGTFPNITSLITGSSGSITLDSTTSYFLNFTSQADDDTPRVLAQNWLSLGTMWDPETAKATDTTWLTTRPNNTIGTGKAWLNWQWTEYDNPSAFNIYLEDTSGDLVTGTTYNARLVASASNSTPFNNSYSTTNIPKDTS